MPDRFYILLQSFADYMNSVSLLDVLVMAVAGAIMLPLLVAIHEAGHALAAVALRHRLAELTVGDDTPLLTVRTGSFRLRLGAITGRSDVSGYVVYDGSRATPRDTFLIALAGPAASLAGALLTGLATAWAWPHPTLSISLGALTLGGLMTGVANLRVRGDSPATWSDGVWVRAAWRVMRAPAAGATWRDPREATSVAPPG